MHIPKYVYSFYYLCVYVLHILYNIYAYIFFYFFKFALFFSLTHLDLTISVFKNCILKNAMFFFL